MKVDRPFKPTGKRLENLNNLIQTKYPQDKWVLEPILPIFLSIIDSSSTFEQQEQVIDLLDKVFNDYEFRYNTILENTTMSNEFKRMMELAGLPTQETTTEENTTETLNENFVGIPAINNVFEREKTDYELAFEHFTKGTSLNEEMEEEDEFDLNQAFKNSPETAPYEDVLEIVDSYGDYSTLDAFQGMFSEDEEVSKKDYFKFFSNYIDDMSDVEYIKANWISIFDEDIFDKAGLNEEKAGKKVTGTVMYGKLNK
jgi:hypothetical protein